MACRKAVRRSLGVLGVLGVPANDSNIEIGIDSR